MWRFVALVVHPRMSEPLRLGGHSRLGLVHLRILAGDGSRAVVGELRDLPFAIAGRLWRHRGHCQLVCESDRHAVVPHSDHRHRHFLHLSALGRHFHRRPALCFPLRARDQRPVVPGGRDHVEPSSRSRLGPLVGRSSSSSSSSPLQRSRVGISESRVVDFARLRSFRPSFGQLMFMNYAFRTSIGVPTRMAHDLFVILLSMIACCHFAISRPKSYRRTAVGASPLPYHVICVHWLCSCKAESNQPVLGFVRLSFMYKRKHSFMN